MTRQERTGWRDLALSELHRSWGVNVPAVDIDLFLEYDRRKSVAIIEYGRNGGRAKSVATDANLAALLDLANRARLPLIGVRYDEDRGRRWWFTVVPLNDYAVRVLPKRTKMNGDTYMRFLYEIFERLNKEKSNVQDTDAD